MNNITLPDVNFGICALSIVPVRKESSDRSEQVTQLLFGEVFKVINKSDDQKWLHIENYLDSYKGWIDVKQASLVTRNYFEDYISNNHPYSKELFSFVSNSRNQFPIVSGSILPFYNNGIIDLGNYQLNYSGQPIHSPSTSEYKVLEKIAVQYLKAPYLWGGRSILGIDCSGYMQQIYKFAGIQLPRDAWQQEEKGIKIPFNEKVPGDIAFFNNAQGRVVHVGMVLPDQRIIHASGEVRIDLIDDKGIFNEDLKSYSHKLFSIKRIKNFL